MRPRARCAVSRSSALRIFMPVACAFGVSCICTGVWGTDEPDACVSHAFGCGWDIRTDGAREMDGIVVTPSPVFPSVSTPLHASAFLSQTPRTEAGIQEGRRV